LRAKDGVALDAVAGRLEGMGSLLLAAETFAQAATAHRAHARTRLANASTARAAALAGICGAAPTPALSSAASPTVHLSEREREVASLAARGMSNRAIARALQLSTRTVESHLYRACTKVGASGRGELAAHITS
jgi:DNA-binding CsgD family transcriptional regulator